MSGPEDNSADDERNDGCPMCDEGIVRYDNDEHEWYCDSCSWSKKKDNQMTDTTQEEPPPHNPWRTFIENCINGDNYFRASEYRDLLSDLDAGYAAQECIATLKAELAQCQSDRQREHDARCTAAGSLEAAQSQAAAMAGLLEEARDTWLVGAGGDLRDRIDAALYVLGWRA